MGGLAPIHGIARDFLAPDGLERLQDIGLVAPGAALEQVEGVYRFTEGPSAFPDGSVVFTDQPNNRIYRWRDDGGVDLLLENALRANGLATLPDGRLVACAEEVQALVAFDLKGDITILAGGFADRPFNSPNDVWRHPSGHFFITDPVYPRSWAPDRPATQPVRGVYSISPKGKVRLVISDLQQPNGIVGSNDGRVLFVSDIDARKVWKYDLDEEFVPRHGRVFCELPSDGMTLDEKGNLYLTNREGVTVVDPTGKVLGTISIPQPWTANVTFGGPDRRTLFITASKHAYTLRMAVRGATEQTTPAP